MLKSESRQDPLQHIPLEITAPIFETFCKSYHDFMNQFKAPFKLGQICRSWREISWSTPQLWTSVAALPGKGEQNRVELLQEYIHRSGNLPLNMYAIWGYPRGIPVADAFLPIVEALKSCIFRCHTLSLSLPVEALSLLARDPVKPQTGSSQLLRRLMVFTEESSSLLPSDIDFSSITGNLESFLLVKNDDGLRLNHVRMIISNLKSITAHGSINRWVEILRSSPCLETAIIISDNSENTTEDIRPVFTHKSLKALKLRSLTTQDLHSIFSLLIYPNLESIFISESINDDELFTPLPNDFLLLLSNSGRNLQIFHFVNMSWDDEDLAQAFADISLPNLREFVIHRPQAASLPQIASVVFGENSDVVSLRFPKLELFEVESVFSESNASHAWDFLYSIERHCEKQCATSQSNLEMKGGDDRVSKLALVKMRLFVGDTDNIFDFIPYLRPQDLETVKRLEQRGTKLKITGSSAARILETATDIIQHSISRWEVGFDGLNREDN